MTKLQEKAQGHAKEAVGQIVGNDQLVREGKKQARRAGDTSKGQEQSKARAKNAPKGGVQKSEAADKTLDPTGRKGPVLE